MPTVPLIAPDTDPATAYPVVAELRAALDARDWPAVREVFATVDADGASLLAHAAGETRQAYGFLSATVEAALDQGEAPDPLAATLLASNLIRAGWEVRSAARASEVSAEQFAEFHDYLRRAEKLLAGATDVEPAMVAAWEQRIITAMGLQLGLEEAWGRYQQAIGHAPHHLPAQQQMLQVLCPKWGGSFEQMHAFARDCAAAAPEGAPNAVLVAIAHLEHWLEIDGAGGYLSTRQVWQELRAAADRSVWHPDFRRRYGWVQVQNTFAMAFSLAGDGAAAAACFAATGHLADEWPWMYLGDPVREFHEHRKRAKADAPPPTLREAPPSAAPSQAALQVASRPPAPRFSTGALLGVIAAWAGAGVMLLCGAAGIWVAATEEMTAGDWVQFVVVWVVAAALALLAVWLTRRGRRAPAPAASGEEMS